MAEEEKKYSILDELAKCSGYSVALMTTFNYEIGFFERAVLNRLLAKDVKTVSLFVDAKELTNALNEFDILHSGSHIGRKYMVTPVRMEGSFHPKVILLLGEKKARLFVGSANIKTSGYATNNEVFNYVDYDAGHPECLDVIVAAIDFFDAVNTISYGLDKEVIKTAKEFIYYHKAEKNGEVSLINNLKRPLLEQVAEIIPEGVESISVAVPYYDKELLALRQIMEKYPEATFNLYVQDKNSTFPVAYNEKKHIVENINIFSRFLDNSSSTSGNFYHGKVFLFKTANNAYVLYGSANCTLSALTKTPSNGGNAECDLLEVGEIGEFDYFFENMDLETKEKLASQEMIYENMPSPNYYFKYGEVKDVVELHIGYAKEENVVVKLGDQELEHEIVKGELLAYVGEELKNVLADIFEISLTYGGKKEILRCWTFNALMLENNREVHNKKDSLSNFEMDSFGNKYIEDRMKILRATATCNDDLIEYKNLQKYINQIKAEQEGDGIGEGADDFVVDFQIPDEYRYAYRQYKEVARIRNSFLRRFLNPFGENGGDGEKKVHGSTANAKEGPDTPVIRKATSEEVAFERFVKGTVKGMMNDHYVEGIEVDHYVGLVGVILEVFERYSGKVEDIFRPEYVMETRIQFMRKILGKSIDNLLNKEEMRSAIVRESIAAILETFLYYRKLEEDEDRARFEALSKKLLRELDKKYNLRQSYHSAVKEVVREGKGGVLTLGYEGSCKYIEQLFGYKTQEMLEQIIFTAYPNAEIIRKGSSLTINFNTDHIQDYVKPNSMVLKEIAKYGRYVSKIDMVYVNVRNTSSGILKKTAIVQRKHIIDMEHYRWSQSMVLKNGMQMDAKPQYLSF